MRPELVCASRAAAPADSTMRELSAALDEELSALPARHREPLLLCYLEGMTRDQAARRLSLSLRTLDRRLVRGRELLRSRLAKQGLTLSAAILAAGLAEGGTSVAIPALLVAGTVKSAAAFARKSTNAAAGPIAELASGLLKNMAKAKLRALAVVLLGASVVTAGGGLLGRKVYAAREQPELHASAPAKPPLAPEPAPEETRHLVHTDRFGDPLPAGVVASMGSRRMRAAYAVHSLAYSPDGRSLAAGTEKGIWVWDTITGRVLRRFHVPETWKVDIRFVTDANLACAAGHSTAQYWLLDIRNGNELLHTELPSAATEFAIAPDGKRVAVCARGQHRSPG